MTRNAKNSGPVRIVLADDHRMFADGIAHLFSRIDDLDVVAITDNGNDLLAIMETERPDVALVDVSMPGPGLSGILEHVNNSDSPCRIVALTMHLEASFAAGLMNDGLAGYVVKDAAFDEVVEAVQIAYAGGRFVSSKLADAMEHHGSSNSILTGREVECLTFAADGLTNKMIAKRLAISERTVKFHFENICRKLAAGRRGQAVAKARQLRLID